MPSPLAGFQLEVTRSPAVQLVKLLTNPKRAISKRIFIRFGRYKSVNAAVELTIIGNIGGWSQLQYAPRSARGVFADLPRIALSDNGP